MMLLSDRLALVTGAARGNGAAISLGLAAHGARVIATDIDGPGAEATARRILSEGSEAWAFPLDVGDQGNCAALAERIGREIGDVSVLVNNAGIIARHSIDTPDVAEIFRQVLDVNLIGTLNVTLAFVPALRRSRGAVVNVSSIAAFVSTATSVGYSTSKAGIRMLTQNLAQELARDGVRVNAIAPGTLNTAMTEATRSDPERRARFLARIPMGRFGEPEELVGPVVFLASEMASYVTGTTLVVDGGFLAV
jgi:NAD(P)-dependent dehydrogenase (short-subunit alcohol dehydrogenase family)